MDVTQVIRELIAVPEQAEPVASVYLDSQWDDEQKRKEVRVLVQDQSRRALKHTPNEHARQRLAQTLAPVGDYVDGLVRQRLADGARGVALFSSAPLSLFRVVTTQVPFRPMELRLERRPVIAPMVRALAAWPTVFVAMVDAEGGTLLEQRAGEVDLEAHIARPFPGRHSRGGWSQRRISQKLGAIRERNLRAVAEPLVALADREPQGMVVLAGQHFNLIRFEELLPDRIRARIAGRLPIPWSGSENETQDEVLKAAQPVVEAAMRARRQVERDTALAEAARGGLGASGMPATLLALAEGRAHRILLDRDLDAGGGRRCDNCGALFGDSSATCSFCGSATRGADLVEEVVRRAVEADAEVAFLPAGVGLPPGTGMAAQLRHRGTAPVLQPPLGERAGPIL